MRRFAVVGHRAATSPDFPLDDLPGSAGRLDILARCANAAFVRSHGVRTDAEITLVLQGPPRPPRTLRLVGEHLRFLNPDERSTAARFRKALEYDGILEKEISPGIFASGEDFTAAVRRLSPPYVLEPTGTDIRRAPLNDDATFFLSDHEDLTAAERATVDEFGGMPLSVGPVSLHADQVITLIHNELDRRAARDG